MIDVDGTLTESFDLDSSSFLDALRVFGFLYVSGPRIGMSHAGDVGGSMRDDSVAGADHSRRQT